jgi:hypothetical protein
MTLRDRLRQNIQNLSARRDARPQPVSAQREGTGVSIGGNHIRAQNVTNEALGTGDAVVFSGDGGVVQQERRRVEQSKQLFRPVLSLDCATKALVFSSGPKSVNETYNYEWWLVTSSEKTLIHRLTIPTTKIINNELVNVINIFYEDLFTVYTYGFAAFVASGREHTFHGAQLFSSNESQKLIISISIPYSSANRGPYSASVAFWGREWIYDLFTRNLDSYKECFYYSSQNSDYAEWRFIDGDMILYNSVFYGGSRIPFVYNNAQPPLRAEYGHPTNPFGMPPSANIIPLILASVGTKTIWYRGFLEPNLASRVQYKYDGFDLRKENGDFFSYLDSFYNDLFNNTNILDDGNTLSIYTTVFLRDNTTRFFELNGKVAVPVNAYIFVKVGDQYRLTANQGQRSNQNIEGGWQNPQTEQYAVVFNYSYDDLIQWQNSTQPKFKLLNMAFVPQKVCKFSALKLSQG